jgi:hypothetical protein
MERLAQEVAELRAELNRRGLRWRGRRHNNTGGDDQGLMSRRRLFGLLGGAAAAGAGLAVAGSTLGAEPAGATVVTAGAADGDALQIGGSNTCTSVSSLSATNATSTFSVANTGSGAGVVGTAIGQDAVRGTSTNSAGVAGASTNSSGVFAFSTNGNSVFVAAPTANTAGAHLRLEPTGAGAGPPTAGAHLLGQFWVDSPGVLWQCVAAGTPGTWVRQSPLVTLSAPVRVYDSRTGQPNHSPNVQGSLTFTSPPPSAAARTISCSQPAGGGTAVVPSGATKLLLNLTVITIGGVGALAVFPTGASQPSASSINWSAGGQVLANGLTSACDTSQNVDVAIVASTGATTDFILDVTGYYL